MLFRLSHIDFDLEQIIFRQLEVFVTWENILYLLASVLKLVLMLLYLLCLSVH